MFAHQSVLETLLCGDTAVPCSQFHTHLDELNKSQEGISNTQEQFEVSIAAILIYCTQQAVILLVIIIDAK